MGKRIRDEKAFAKAQDRMRIRHQKEVEHVAARIHAIVRSTEDTLTFASPLQALIFLAKRGAIKRHEGRHHGVDRQTLVRQGLARAVELKYVLVESNGESLSIGILVEPVSPDIQRQLTRDRYEELGTSAIPGHHLHRLKRRGAQLDF